jgi:bacillolysin
LKKLISLSLIIVFFADQSYAQFKKVDVGITKPTRVVFPKGPRIDETSKKEYSFNPKSLSLADVKAAAAGFSIIQKDDNGLPLAISGKSKVDGGRNQTIEKRTYSHLSALAPILNVKNVDEQFIISNITKDEDGDQHVRLHQEWNGITVYGNELIVHEDNKEVNFVNGRYDLQPQNLATKASISKEKSLQNIEQDLGEILDVSKVDKKLIPTNAHDVKLVYYKSKEGKFSLTYHQSVYKNIIERWDYFVDAIDGKIIEKYPSMCKFHNHKGGSCNHSNVEISNSEKVENTINAETSVMMDGPATANALDLFNVSRLINTYLVGSKYYLIDGSRSMFKTSSVMPNDPEGTILTLDAFNTSPQKDNFNYDHFSGNNTWASKLSVSAHFNGGKAYEYFKNIHTRNSINGSGGNIVSFVNIADEDGSMLGNAFWNGAAMFYGNGDENFFQLARGLDVAAHEMSHGVIQNTANLVYQGESGALNESYADVFGTLVDRDDWLVGEDVVKTSAFPSGALRSMIDPHNGAPTGNFGKGWQPRTFAERYTGTQDNGGVHINSGIPNYAYYLFASNAAVGKDRAEKVYYRALSTYLTKNSKFVDQRIAVIKAATDLYGASVANVAASAFDQVGITGATGTKTETDVVTNPGNEYVLFTTELKDNIYLYTSTGTPVGNPLSQKNPSSKPSVTDDGSTIAFVNSDKKVTFIYIDWANQKVSEETTEDAGFRNVAISKDGSKVAFLTDVIDNKLTVFNLEANAGKEFVLTNPTYSEGVSTGDVLYADAIEWDFNGEYVMYDAENQLKSPTAGAINYWDISFIKVWDNKTKNFTNAPYIVDKLFPSLDEGLSVGNPTFSKNSPYIIAFDYVNSDAEEKDQYKVLGANIEKGDVALINDNRSLGYPSYSKNDRRLIYTRESKTTTNNLYFSDLATDKITGVAGTEKVFKTDAVLGTYFSNGARVVSSLDPEEKAENILSVAPNPASFELDLNIKAISNGTMTYEVSDITGKLILKGGQNILSGSNAVKINVSKFNSGLHFIKVTDEKNTSVSISFVKI